MNKPLRDREVRNIPIDRIEVLNTRDRNGRVFESIVGNIQAIGIKKPITVSPRPGPDGAERYVLVCGEGRLNALRLLGQTRIPAQVFIADDEEAYIMSLVENLARRRYRPLESLAGVTKLHEQNYTDKEIAEKTGLGITYIHGILLLLEKGEEKLMAAIEKGRLPVSVALNIVSAGGDDKAIQLALQGAYETGELRGKKMIEMRRILESRRTSGPRLNSNSKNKDPGTTTQSLVKAFRREYERQKLFVCTARVAEQRLMFVAGALRGLLADENFVNLLRAEGLDTLPKLLAERVNSLTQSV